MKSIYHYTGKLGRFQQIITGLKKLVAEYEACLRAANERFEHQVRWRRAACEYAHSASEEMNHWKDRALAAEAELFEIKNKS